MGWTLDQTPQFRKILRNSRAVNISYYRIAGKCLLSGFLGSVETTKRFLRLSHHVEQEMRVVVDLEALIEHKINTHFISGTDQTRSPDHTSVQ